MGPAPALVRLPGPEGMRLPCLLGVSFLKLHIFSQAPFMSLNSQSLALMASSGVSYHPGAGPRAPLEPRLLLLPAGTLCCRARPSHASRVCSGLSLWSHCLVHSLPLTVTSGPFLSFCFSKLTSSFETLSKGHPLQAAYPDFLSSEQPLPVLIYYRTCCADLSFHTWMSWGCSLCCCGKWLWDA